METLKVLVISSVGVQTPPSKGGYGGLEAIAAYHAIALKQLGHEVTIVISADSCVDNYTPHGVKTIKTVYSRLNPIPEADSFEIWKRRIGNIHGYDIVQDHSHCFHSYMLQKDSPDGLKTDPPVVRTVHDDRPFQPNGQISSDGILQANPPPIKFPCWVSPSFASARRLEESMQGSVVRTVWHGIPHTMYDYGTGESGRFLFCGRIQYIKGVHLAIEAAKLANAGLDIIGPHTHLGQDVYVQKIRNVCDGKQIVYHGEVDSASKVRFMQNAKAIIVPSLFGEPFGLIVPEANFCGTPAIVLNRGGLQETTIDGKTGYICSSVIDMVRAMFKIGNLKREECRDWAMDNFRLEHMVNRYLTLYKDAMEGKMW